MSIWQIYFLNIYFMIFPDIPKSKIYNGNTTPEQDAQMKLVQGMPLTEADTEALQESVSFYEEAYPFLKGINLSVITDSEKDEIIQFLDIVLNYEVIFQNNLIFKNVFRISIVKDKFLDSGKVRDVKFISYPHVDIIKDIGKYGRANSVDSTCFYCAFNPIVALLETKPNIGDRIIISQWHKDDHDPFISFPIANNDDVKNEGLENATKAFKERMSCIHPLFAKTLDLLFEFLSSEYIKSIPIKSSKAYEYLYSAYFADKTLLNHITPVAYPTQSINDYDCIIYPSIAAKHATDNIAVKPESVKRLKPVYLQDIIVEITDYDHATIYENYFPEEIDLPIGGKLLRTSNNIDNGKIIWSDD